MAGASAGTDNLIGPPPFWVEPDAKPMVQYLGSRAVYTWIRLFSEPDAPHMVSVEQKVTVDAYTAVPRVSRESPKVIFKGPRETTPAAAAALSNALDYAAATLAAGAASGPP